MFYRQVCVVSLTLTLEFLLLLFPPCLGYLGFYFFRVLALYRVAESKKAVVLLGLGGLVQLGRSSSLRILKVLKTRLFPAGAPCHFPFGALPKPAFAVLPPIVFCLVASFM